MTFISGQSGNSNGRPRGARAKLTEKFLKTILAEYKKHYKTLLPAARKADPGGFLKTIASILPKNVRIDPDGGALFQILVESKPKALESANPIDVQPTHVLAEITEDDDNLE